MFALKRAAVAVIGLWGQASALDPQEVAPDLNFCHLSGYDNQCVRCIYEGGDFYSKDGFDQGLCIKKKIQVLPSFIKRREIRMECEQLEYDKLPQPARCKDASTLQTDEQYIKECRADPILKSRTINLSKSSSYNSCKDTNWRTNISDKQNSYCANGNADCKLSCRNIAVKEKDKDVNGMSVPCILKEERTYINEVNRVVNGQDVIEYNEVTKLVCVQYQDWTSFNHTVRVPSNQACALTVNNKFVAAKNELPWIVGFNFAENDGVAVIVQKTDESANFWGKPEGSDWALLTKPGAAHGGRLSVPKDKEWHVILVNTKSGEDAFINLRYGQAASLALSLATAATLFLLAQ